MPPTDEEWTQCQSDVRTATETLATLQATLSALQTQLTEATSSGASKTELAEIRATLETTRTELTEAKSALTAAQGELTQLKQREPSPSKKPGEGDPPAAKTPASRRPSAWV